MSDEKYIVYVEDDKKIRVIPAIDLTLEQRNNIEKGIGCEVDAASPLGAVINAFYSDAGLPDGTLYESEGKRIEVVNGGLIVSCEPIRGGSSVPEKAACAACAL